MIATCFAWSAQASVEILILNEFKLTFSNPIVVCSMFVVMLCFLDGVNSLGGDQVGVWYGNKGSRMTVIS